MSSDVIASPGWGAVITGPLLDLAATHPGALILILTTLIFAFIDGVKADFITKNKPWLKQAAGWVIEAGVNAFAKSRKGVRK